MKTGDTVNERFVLEALLSETPVGSVFKALDLRQQESEVENPYVALKILPAAMGLSGDRISHLCRVSVESRRLHHQNVMHFYDFDAADEGVFMTMPLLNGMPLSMYLEQQDIDLPEAARITCDICAAFSCAAALPLAHGDFSPHKVFYTSDGVCKVFDFGVRQVFIDLLGDNHSVYASVDVLNGSDPTVVDDLFSVAVVCYELLSGHHPFQELTAHQAAQEKLSVEPIASIPDQAWLALEANLSLSTKPTIDNLRRFAESVRGMN